MLATLSSAISAPETAAGASPTGAPSSPTPSSPPPSSTAPPPRSSDHDQRPLLPHATPPDPRRPAPRRPRRPQQITAQAWGVLVSTSGEFRCALTLGGSLHCVGALEQRPPCLGRSGRGRRPGDQGARSAWGAEMKRPLPDDPVTARERDQRALGNRRITTRRPGSPRCTRCSRGATRSDRPPSRCSACRSRCCR